jgi:hypothetical protein
MPDPMGGKRLLDYDCKVKYSKSSMIQPRKIRKQEDIRPGTKKGKLDKLPIWLVEIQMPKKLIVDIYTGYAEEVYAKLDSGGDENVTPEADPVDAVAAAPAAPAAPAEAPAV